MSWKAKVAQGLNVFRTNNYQEALELFGEAINLGAQGHMVYDSRAATLEKLGRYSDALKDTRKVIQLNPQADKGYVRAARLFKLLRKYDKAISMAKLALDRVTPSDEARVAHIRQMIEQITTSQQAFIQATTCHISRLPVELLSIIFNLASDNRPSFVTTLVAVCGYWRSIIVDLPSAWQSLVITRNKPATKTRLWLERARHKVSSIVIRENINLPQLRKVIQELTTNDAAALLHMQVTVDHDRTFQNYDALFPYFTRNLTKLEISGNAVHYSQAMDVFLPKNPPTDYHCSLQHLILHRVQPVWDLMEANLRDMRTLIIQDIEPSDSPPSETMIRILGHSPNIERLGLGSTEYQIEQVDSTPETGRLDLPRLTHLHTSRLFKVLHLATLTSTPNLQIFQISRHPLPEPVLEEISSPHISELRINGAFQLRASVMLPLLCRWHLLETLELSKLSGPGGEINEIVDGLSTPSVCPLLHYANFSDCVALRTGTVVDLVKSRLIGRVEGGEGGQSCTLRTLLIDGCPQIQSDVLPWLRSKVQKVSCNYQIKAAAKGGKRVLF